MLLSNKVAIITGGARGIGRGIAMKFAEEGCSPVIVDVLVAEGRKTAEELSKKERDAVFIKCDITKSNEVKEMVDQVIGKFGKVDILVNNAGTAGLPKSVTDITEEEWDRVLGINLKGIFLCCKSVAPYMREKGFGKIVNISSLSAIYPVASNVHYTASKAGVLGLTLDLALELAPFNICVNVILPGPIPSDMWNTLIPPGMNREEFFAGIGKAVMPPMERLGTPEDIAGVALFLASDLSRYVTGDRIIVGGGAPYKRLH